MSYLKTTWIDDVTPASATNLNNIETGIVELQDRVQALNGGNKIQSGLGSITVNAAGAARTEAIIFPVPFTTPPIILCLPSEAYTDAGYVNLTVTESFLTYFTLQLNSYVAQTIVFRWLAIGD